MKPCSALGQPRGNPAATRGAARWARRWGLEAAGRFQLAKQIRGSGKAEWIRSNQIGLETGNTSGDDSPRGELVNKSRQTEGMQTRLRGGVAGGRCTRRPAQRAEPTWHLERGRRRDRLSVLAGGDSRPRRP